MQGKTIAEKTFNVVGRDQAQFWKQRGYQLGL